MAEGWFRMHRKIIDSRVFQNDALLKVWVWCLARANYSEQWVAVTTGRGVSEVHLMPGQFIFGRKAAAKQLRMKPGSVRNRMEKLRTLGNLDLKVDTHCTVVTICKWTTYNGSTPESGQASGQATDRQRTPNGQATDTVKKEEKVKKVKKEEKNASCRALRFDESDLSTAEWMLTKIRELNPTHKKPDLERWANDLRLMRERDGRTDTEIRELFGWANRDDFWRANILSPSKLRKQWDQLAIKRKEQTSGKSSTPVGPGQRHPTPTYGTDGDFT